jgi:two-component system nitrogen regulation response regulator GlnG
LRVRHQGPGAVAPPVAAVMFGSRLSSCSRSMCETFELLRRFAATDVTVTLLGETGAGKDVLAHALHEESARATGPFVIFDCASVAANLAESDLLGHERGAFTGADFAHAGAFERADGGTLFLDEFAELPIDVQPRLLRALESRRVRRVGGKCERDVDVRIVAATNRDLRADVSCGKFREDLYFRLAAAVVPVPPLRDRLDDLPLLVESIFDRLGRGDVRVSDDALVMLRAHPWQGNVRELKNVLSCAAAFLDTGAHLIEPRHLRTMAPRDEQESPLERYSLAGQALEDIERIAIMQTMASSAGNKVSAAHTLGIAVSTLYKKLRKYSL